MSEALIFFFTVIASTGGFVVAVVFLILALVRRKHTKDAIALLLTAAGLMLSVQFLKVWLQVPRPSEALIEVAGYGMPSGHAAGSAFLTLLVIHLSSKFRLPAFYAVIVFVLLLAVFISASRIYFQVHTLSQVLIGSLLGVTFGLIYIFVSKRIEGKKR